MSQQPPYLPNLKHLEQLSLQRASARLDKAVEDLSRELWHGDPTTDFRALRYWVTAWGRLVEKLKGE